MSPWAEDADLRIHAGSEVFTIARMVSLSQVNQIFWADHQSPSAYPVRGWEKGEFPAGSQFTI